MVPVRPIHRLDYVEISRISRVDLNELLTTVVRYLCKAMAQQCACVREV